jgi:hypothetical protein
MSKKIHKIDNTGFDEYADDPNLEVQMNQDEDQTPLISEIPEIDSAGFDSDGNDHYHPNKYYNQFTEWDKDSPFGIY